MVLHLLQPSSHRWRQRALQHAVAVKERGVDALQAAEPRRERPAEVVVGEVDRNE